MKIEKIKKMKRDTIFPFTREEIALANHVWKNYGLKPDDYISMLENQNYVCAICGGIDKNKRLAVDHCHVTGKVRGLLCSPCNLGLGSFRDSIYNIKNAFKYLNRFSELD